MHTERILKVLLPIERLQNGGEVVLRDEDFSAQYRGMIDTQPKPLLTLTIPAASSSDSHIWLRGFSPPF